MDFKEQVKRYMLTRNTFVNSCVINEPDKAEKVFGLLNADKLKPGETIGRQFERMYEIVTRTQAIQRQQDADEQKMNEWKQVKELDYKGKVTPQRIKELLDADLDAGKISEQEHEFGYKGLRILCDFYPERQETDDPDIPF